MQENPQSDVRVSDAQRARLLGELRALAGATLQKITLLSPQLVALQLRVPGRTLFALLDARAALVALVAEKPSSPPERESAPRSQATLRAALSGANLSGARLERPATAPVDSRQVPALRLSFATPQGLRSLIAEPHAGMLALLSPAADAEERIVWMSPVRKQGTTPAGGELRAGSQWPPSREIHLEEKPPADIETGDSESEPSADAAFEFGARALAQAEDASIEARRRALLKRLRTAAQKAERTLRAVEADAVRARAAAAERTQAQLLLPEQTRVPRGAREVLVPDWSQLDEAGLPAQILIKLDPAFSAAENASRWLKRAHRYGAALPRIESRLAGMRAALDEARALVAQAEQAPGALALRDLELRVPGRAQSTRARSERPGKVSARLPFRSFRAQGDGRILVGRSARDNDALTFAAARGNDLWLHARGVQGSHVIVPDPGASPDGDLLLSAALLAAHFSSARDEALVEVMWTRRKYVRKPKGAAPGAVICTQEKTLRVRMDEAQLAVLLAREEK